MQGNVANHIRSRESVEESRSLNAIDVCEDTLLNSDGRDAFLKGEKSGKDDLARREQLYEKQNKTFRRSDDNGEARLCDPAPLYSSVHDFSGHGARERDY